MPQRRWLQATKYSMALETTAATLPKARRRSLAVWKARRYAIRRFLGGINSLTYFVAQNCILRDSRIYQRARNDRETCRLQIGDTADCKSGYVSVSMPVPQYLAPLECGRPGFRYRIAEPAQFAYPIQSWYLRS
jgi:hypothetical protein